MLPEGAVWPDPPPPNVPLTTIHRPDFQDYNVYPPEARALEQEGTVIPETLVGKNGIPIACRIVKSSGFAELDDGSCALMLEMRFAPPRAADGRNVETVFKVKLDWSLSEPTPFGPARIVARLTLKDGAVDDCAVDRSGSVPAEWLVLACRTIANQAAYYLGDGRFRARRASVVVAVGPAGTAAAAAQPGRRVAQRLTEFELTREGDVRNCRTTRNDGFGAPRFDHQGPCGFFLVKPWFEPDPDAEAPARGTIEVSVYLEPGRGR